VAIDYDENWFTDRAADRLKLSNTTGKPMTRCTVQAEVRGEDGTWIRDVRYVAEWRPGKELIAEYPSGAKEDATMRTVAAIRVQEVKVSVWCDELSRVEQKLQYVGAPRDEDMLRALNDKLNVEIDYVAKPFTEPGPSLGVRFMGIASLPPCHVTLICKHAQGEPQTFEFNHGAWRDGLRFSYPSRGVLRGMPEAIDVVLRLDMMGADWKKTVGIARHR
jgi:hypothetical protein